MGFAKGQKYKTGKPIPDTMTRKFYDKLVNDEIICLEELKRAQRRNLIDALRNRYDLSIKLVKRYHYKLEESNHAN